MKKVLLVAALGALVFSMSGCFIMRTLTFNKNTLKHGDTFTAQMSVAGETGEGGPEYPFFMVLGETSLPINGGKWDTKGKLGGPVALKHSANGDAIAGWAGDVCDVPFAKGPGTLTGDNIVLTKKPFKAKNPAKFMKAKVPIRYDPPNAMTESDGIVIWMGSWIDDGDGVAEDPSGNEDEYSCQPPYTSFMVEKGASPVPKF